MHSEMVGILGKLLDEKLTEKFDSIQKDIDKLAKGQDEIKELIKDIEPKNANRHVEIIHIINDLRKDLNAVEVVTCKNWNDIANLKAVK